MKKLWSLFGTNTAVQEPVDSSRNVARRRSVSENIATHEKHSPLTVWNVEIKTLLTQICQDAKQLLSSIPEESDEFIGSLLNSVQSARRFVVKRGVTGDIAEMQMTLQTFFESKLGQTLCHQFAYPSLMVSVLNHIRLLHLRLYYVAVADEAVQTPIAKGLEQVVEFFELCFAALAQCDDLMGKYQCEVETLLRLIIIDVVPPTAEFVRTSCHAIVDKIVQHAMTSSMTLYLHHSHVVTDALEALQLTTPTLVTKENVNQALKALRWHGINSIDNVERAVREALDGERAVSKFRLPRETDALMLSLQTLASILVKSYDFSTVLLNEFEEANGYGLLEQLILRANAEHQTQLLKQLDYLCGSLPVGRALASLCELFIVDYNNERIIRVLLELLKTDRRLEFSKALVDVGIQKRGFRQIVQDPNWNPDWVTLICAVLRNNVAACVEFRELDLHQFLYPRFKDVFQVFIDLSDSRLIEAVDAVAIKEVLENGLETDLTQVMKHLKESDHVCMVIEVLKSILSRNFQLQMFWRESLHGFYAILERVKDRTILLSVFHLFRVLFDPISGAQDNHQYFLATLGYDAFVNLSISIPPEFIFSFVTDQDTKRLLYPHALYMLFKTLPLMKPQEAVSALNDLTALLKFHPAISVSELISVGALHWIQDLEYFFSTNELSETTLSFIKKLAEYRLPACQLFHVLRILSRLMPAHLFPSYFGIRPIQTHRDGLEMLHDIVTTPPIRYIAVGRDKYIRAPTKIQSGGYSFAFWLKIPEKLDRSDGQFCLLSLYAQDGSFIRFYLDKNTILTAESFKKKITFEAIQIQCKTWHHLVFSHKRSVLSASYLCIYVDGNEMATVKCPYPSLALTQCYIGVDTTLCHNVGDKQALLPALEWILGPCYLTEEVMGSIETLRLFMNGPSERKLSDPTFFLTHLGTDVSNAAISLNLANLIMSSDSEGFEKYLLGLEDQTAVIQTKADQVVLFRQFIYSVCESFDLGSAYIPTGNMLTTDKIQCISTGYIEPIDVAQALPSLGGVQFLLLLIENAHSSAELLTLLQILWFVVYSYLPNLVEFQQIDGYAMLRELLKQKMDVMDSKILEQLIFFAVNKDQKLISNRVALKELILRVQWSDELLPLVFKHFESMLETKNVNSTFNARQLRLLDFLFWCLHHQNTKLVRCFLEIQCNSDDISLITDFLYKATNQKQLFSFLFDCCSVRSLLDAIGFRHTIWNQHGLNAKLRDRWQNGANSLDFLCLEVLNDRSNENAPIALRLLLRLVQENDDFANHVFTLFGGKLLAGLKHHSTNDLVILFCVSFLVMKSVVEVPLHLHATLKDLMVIFELPVAYDIPDRILQRGWTLMEVFIESCPDLWSWLCLLLQSNVSLETIVLNRIWTADASITGSYSTKFLSFLLKNDKIESAQKIILYQISSSAYDTKSVLTTVCLYEHVLLNEVVTEIDSIFVHCVAYEAFQGLLNEDCRNVGIQVWQFLLSNKIDALKDLLVSKGAFKTQQIDLLHGGFDRIVGVDTSVEEWLSLSTWMSENYQLIQTVLRSTAVLQKLENEFATHVFESMDGVQEDRHIALEQVSTSLKKRLESNFSTNCPRPRSQWELTRHLLIHSRSIWSCNETAGLGSTSSVYQHHEKQTTLDFTEGPSRMRLRLHNFKPILKSYCANTSWNELQDSSIYAPLFHELHVEDRPPLYAYNCVRVAGLAKIQGLLVLGPKCVYFLAGYIKEAEKSPLSKKSSKFQINYIGESTDPSLSLVDPTRKKWSENDELIHPKNITLCYDNVREFYRLKYQLRQVAIEFSDLSGSNFFIQFATQSEREQVFKCLFSMPLPNSVFQPHVIRTGALTLSMKRLLQNETRLWLRGELTNFEYLMRLNTFSGRSYNDLTQYPIFPWILADYTSETLDLNDPSVYRDLSKPMGAIGDSRAKQFTERYEAMQEVSDDPPFHYGTHYSCSAYVVNYLVRLEPFAGMARDLQGGEYDKADRLFRNVQGSWYSASTENLQDVRELIPEFYSLPEFLFNANDFVFGKTQRGEIVNHVVLPPWCHDDPREFIRLQRKALESDFVSENLHHWIDLIFGAKQKGPAAVEAQNVFMHMTYEGSIDVDTITDAIERDATIAQIENFGQTPSQLFSRPHPARKIPSPRADLIDNERLHPIKWHTRLTPPLHCILGDQTAVYLCSSGLTKVLDEPIHDLLILPDKVVYQGMGKALIPPKGTKCFTLEDFPSSSPLMQICVAATTRRLVATGGQDAIVTVYQYESNLTHHQLGVLTGHHDQISCLAISTEFNLLVTGSLDSTVIVWDLRHLMYIRHLAGFQQSIDHIAINDRTGHILTVVDKELRLWSINGDLLARTHALSSISALTSTQCEIWQDGIVAITGHEDGSLVLWGMSTHPSSYVDAVPISQERNVRPSCEWIVRQKMDQHHASPITCIRISADQRQFVSADASGSSIRWSATDCSNDIPQRIPPG